MTIPEILNSLTDSKKGEAVHIQFPVKVAEPDAQAAELLLWLFGRMEDATLGEVHEVLDAAKWWATLLHSAVPTVERANRNP